MLEYSSLATTNSAITSGKRLAARIITPGAIERHVIVCGALDPGPEEYDDPDDIPKTAVIGVTDDCSTCSVSRRGS